MTKREWIPVSDILMAAYGQSRFTPETLMVWFEMLKDLAANEVRQSVERMVKTQAFPTIAEIRDKCTPPRDVTHPWEQFEEGTPEYIEARRKAVRFA